MSSQNLPTIAFFGATGGVTLTILSHALHSQTHCIALARTPAKLTSALQAMGHSGAQLDEYLTIVPGNALSKSDVTSTLTTQPGHIVTHIVSGLGAAPTLRFNPWNPFAFVTIDQPDLCGDAARVLVSALTDLAPSTAPDLTFISTTGICAASAPADVPYMLRFLYHVLLAVPHIDKRNMERAFIEAGPRVFKDVVGIRPTLLSGSAMNPLLSSGSLDLGAVRAGTEQAPAVGYYVSRADVGAWTWRNVLATSAGREKWAGEMVSLTY